MIVSVEQDVPPATGTVTTTTQPTQTQGMRLVVTGDVDFASDPLVQQLNATTNLDLFTNIVNWLSESEDRISIPTPSTTAPTLTLGLAEQQLTFYTTVVILPLLVQQLNATTNLDLFTNIINWLSESEDRISIPAPSTTAPTLTLGLAEQSLTFYTTVVILPLLVLLIGGFIWWRRR
jgi:ABC-type uncharacterized transport system involved in gliding motility auxiliary subunit